MPLGPGWDATGPIGPASRTAAGGPALRLAGSRQKEIRFDAQVGSQQIAFLQTFSASVFCAFHRYSPSGSGVEKGCRRCGRNPVASYGPPPAQKLQLVSRGPDRMAAPLVSAHWHSRRRVKKILSPVSINGAAAAESTGVHVSWVPVDGEPAPAFLLIDEKI